MKIGIFTDTFSPQINGVTVSLENIVKQLRKKRNKVLIYAPDINRYKDVDASVIRLPSMKVLSSEPEVRVPLPTPNKNLRQIFRHDIDIVHAHGNGAFSLLGYQVARMKGIPYILTFHTIHTQYTHYFLNGKVIRPRMIAAGMRAFANLCDGIITPSEKMKEELQRYGVKKPIQVIPNFIDQSKFSHVEKGFLHEMLDIPKKDKIILSVGRLGKEKNFTFVIKMFKKLHEKQKSLHLVICGQGPEKENLLYLADSLHILDYVYFTDQIPENIMPKVYADADIFVFASRTETQGVCVLEAAASGLPIVVAKDTAYDHMVEDGVNGYLLPLRQQLFVKRITELLKNPEQRKIFGIRSRQLAKQNFSPDQLMNQLIQFYKQTAINYKKRDRIIYRVNRVAFNRFIRATEVVNDFFTLR